MNRKGFFYKAKREGRKEASHWYLNYFYNKKEYQILLIWTRPAGNDKTAFTLVSTNKGLDLGKWKNINNSFEDSVNERIKTRFKRLILLTIKKLIKLKTNR